MCLERNSQSIRKLIRFYLFHLEDLKKTLTRKRHNKGKGFISLTNAVVTTACNDCSMAVFLSLLQDTLVSSDLNEFHNQTASRLRFEIRHLKRDNALMSARLFKCYCHVLDSAYQLFLDIDPKFIDDYSLSSCNNPKMDNEFTFVD